MLKKPHPFFITLWRSALFFLILWAQWIRFPETEIWKHFVYYTNQTNLFALFLYFWFFLRHFTRNIPEPPSWLHAGVTFWLLTTMIVYWTLLFKNLSLVGGFTLTLFAGYALHALTPIMILLDWLFFVPHGTLKPSHAFVWLGYPLLYCIGIYFRAELGARLTELSRYPYAFMDLDWTKTSVVIVYLITLAAGFCLLGLCMVCADRLLAYRERPSNPRI